MPCDGALFSGAGGVHSPQNGALPYQHGLLFCSTATPRHGHQLPGMYRAGEPGLGEGVLADTCRQQKALRDTCPAAASQRADGLELSPRSAPPAARDHSAQPRTCSPGAAPAPRRPGASPPPPPRLGRDVTTERWTDEASTARRPFPLWRHGRGANLAGRRRRRQRGGGGGGGGCGGVADSRGGSVTAPATGCCRRLRARPPRSGECQ